MGKKQGKNWSSSTIRTVNHAVSLREESSGKTHADAGSLLKVRHLQQLATWASIEAGVGPLGALLGQRLATNAEASGVPLATSTFLCQRCESVLRPGFNCTIRIKNNKKKAKRQKKFSSCQNSVAYVCHFCGDQNLIWGSGKGVVKSLLSSRKPTRVDSNCRNSKACNKNTRTVVIKETLKQHSQAADLQVESSSGLKQSTPKKDERNVNLKPNLPEESKMDEGVASLTVEPGQLAAATCEDNNMQREVIAATHEENLKETKHISPERVKRCVAGDRTSEAELSARSKFVTPQRNKLMEITDLKDLATPFKIKSTLNKKPERSCFVTDNAPTSSGKSARNDSGKDAKSAPSDSAKLTSGSRKRARKGWTTLKQIAEKDERERKEKMENFVIPFFMQ